MKTLGTVGTTGLLATAHLTNDALMGVLPALLPSLAQRFALDGPELALCVATFAVSSSLPQPVFGNLADRFGGRIVGTVGLLLGAMLVGLVGLVPSSTLLLAVLLVGGLGSAALHPAGILMTRQLDAEHRRLGLSVFTASGMLGSAIGPLITLALLSHYGISSAGWMLVPAVFVAVALYRFGPKRSRSNTEHRLSRAEPFSALRLLRGPVGLLTAAGALASLALLAFTNGVPIWLVYSQDQASGSALIGWTLAAFSTSAAVGNVLAGAAARRFATAPLIVGTLAPAFFTLQGILLVPPGSVWYFVLVALSGALLLAHIPILVHAAQELSPGHEAAASGLVLGVTMAIAGALYALLGRVQPAVGLPITLALGFSAVVPAAFLASVALKRPRETSPAPLLTALAHPCRLP